MTLVKSSKNPCGEKVVFLMRNLDGFIGCDAQECLMIEVV